MSEHLKTATLRDVAAALRETRSGQFCTCVDTDHWFDRSICPEPCGSMHDICVECERIQHGCPVEAQAGEPSEFHLALADLLTVTAENLRRDHGDDDDVTADQYAPTVLTVARTWRDCR